MNYKMIGFIKESQSIPYQKDINPLAAGATTGAGVVGANIFKENIQNKLHENRYKHIRGSRSYSDFLKKLKPGDILYTRTPIKYSANAIDMEDLPKNFQKRLSKSNIAKGIKNIVQKRGIMPLKESEAIQLFSGKPFSHAAIYTGKGNIVEAAGASQGVKGGKLKNVSKAHTVHVYRPKSGANSAVRFAEKQRGGKYTDVGTVLKDVAKSTFVPGGAGKTCRKIPNKGVVCQTLVTKAYPKTFKKELVPMREMQQNKGTQLIAKYIKGGKISGREKFISRFLSPAIRSMKYAVPVAAAGFAAKKIYDLKKANPIQGQPI